MHKRKSTGSSNTLFKYFQPAKSQNKTEEVEIKKSKTQVEDSSDEEIVVSKRKRVIVASDSESENECPNKGKSLNSSTPNVKKAKIKSGESENETNEDEKDVSINNKSRKSLKNFLFGSTPSKVNSEEQVLEEEILPSQLKDKSLLSVKNVKKPKIESDESENEVSEDEKNVSMNNQLRKSLKDFSFGSTPSKVNSKRPVLEEISPSQLKDNSLAPLMTDIHNSWTHNKLEFLKPEKIRDINKNKANDPNYDSKTLYVPDEFLNRQTPAMRQWWILKSRHMDSVLFFKVGKFYELYHMDAVVGVQHLAFSYMKGEFAHSGFPETAYAKMAGALIEKGFKVARVEQTETPEMMTERCKQQKKSTKFDKVVKREICQITTKATCLYSAQMPDASQPLPSYLYAVAINKYLHGIRFGVCFIDTSIGVFHVSEFDDDKHCSKLLTLCSEHSPGYFLLERGKVSNVTKQILNTYYKDVKKCFLTPGTQFLESNKTLENLAGGPYFVDKEGKFKWPDFFEQVANDCLPKPEFELALRAMGACLWYLKDSEIDVQLFSVQKFKMYLPQELETKRFAKRDYMILDSVTIDNLGLVGGVGTLQKVLDYCDTPFGKRMLLQWICRPLCDVEKIKERQAAVKELVEKSSLLSSAKEILKKLPDLERQIMKIHTYGNKFCSEHHPDSRAIFYEAKTYSKRKIHDLLKTLKGFENSQDFISIFEGCESRLLRKITQVAPKGMFLNLQETLNFFEEAFDQQEAVKNGTIIPQAGIDQDYDDVEQSIRDINRELDEYLREQQKVFGCKLKYVGTEKKRFQLEIPDSHMRKVTTEYHLEGTKKGSKKYSTEETRELLRQMLKAEAERAKIVQDLNRRIFEKFSQRYEEWEQVTYCLTYLDLLCSLATYAKNYSHEICLPTVNPFAEKSAIQFTNGRHPCITNVDNFVPNDVFMNTAHKAGCVLITGPNMGGKSTLMRQIAIITVMAQMGSYVPASSCTLDLVDRVFTRLGAHDNILGGQSTFFVELSEAGSILKHATSCSLVLIDELGRGTSTHDGNAIATAYVRKLIELECRTLFSTHYHNLVDKFADRDDIQLAHMACMVENEDDPTKESVTFLYKMIDGKCPKSYGFNAAKLAGLKSSIVLRARQIANDFERKTVLRDTMKKLFAEGTSKMNVMKLISDLKSLSV